MLKAEILRTTPSMPVKKEDHSLCKIPADLLTLGFYTACVAHEPFADISPSYIQKVHYIVNTIAAGKLRKEPLTLKFEDKESQVVKEITIGNTIVDTNLVLKKGFPNQTFGYTQMALIAVPALG
jgi:hypothetical protein